uniref:Uncharacterized protein n=1 Tax=Stomoxys calcitrans TaxID=35570 RepID=A0A1I8P466_STOCA
MKILLNCICIAVIALQLTWAAPMPETTTNGPIKASYYQKRYDIFDSILKEINNSTASSIMAMTTTHASILKDYNEWLTTHKGDIDADKLKLHEIMAENLKTFVKTKESLQNDPHNCELQRKMQTTFFTVENTRNTIGDKEVNQIWKTHQKDVENMNDEAEKKAFSERFFPVLENEFESFLQMLDGAGKEDNKEFIKWYKNFQSKTDLDEKFEEFEEIQDLYEEELERETKAGEVNCRLLANLEWQEEILRGVLTAIASAFKALGNALEKKSN